MFSGEVIFWKQGRILFISRMNPILHWELHGGILKNEILSCVTVIKNKEFTDECMLCKEIFQTNNIPLHPNTLSVVICVWILQLKRNLVHVSINRQKTLKVSIWRYKFLPSQLYSISKESWVSRTFWINVYW